MQTWNNSNSIQSDASKKPTISQLMMQGLGLSSKLATTPAQGKVPGQGIVPGSVMPPGQSIGQSGPQGQNQVQEQFSLPPSILERAELLPFLRKIERIVNEQESLQQRSVLAYWSSADASWLLPDRADLQALLQSTLACSAFSEHRQDPAEEFFFLVLSKELSVIVLGHSIDAQTSARTNPVFQCLVSFNPQLIKRVCLTMSPYWEFIDPMEADKLDSSLRRLGACQTMPHFVNSLSNEWTQIGSQNSRSGAASVQQDLISGGSSSINSANGNAAGSVQGASGSNFDPAQQEQAAAAELWMRIANTYPYPIASPYRTLESITSPAEKYKEQLKLIENLLALLAGISLAISAQNDPKILADLKDCISMGVSMGHWRELIRKSTVAWKSTSTKDIPLAKEILGLRIEHTEKSVFAKSAEKLVRARNDFAHHRGPTAESQIEKETVRLGELLKECITQTMFLCDYPIKIVRAIDILPSGVIKMTCLKAIGDHPALRQEELCLNRGFPKGHMILDAGDSNWLSLYPFVTQDICTTCGTMEIYHLDKWKYDKNLIQVRSFERGHAQESSAISTTLKSIIGSISP